MRTDVITTTTYRANTTTSTVSSILIRVCYTIRILANFEFLFMLREIMYVYTQQDVRELVPTFMKAQIIFICHVSDIYGSHSLHPGSKEPLLHTSTAYQRSVTRLQLGRHFMKGTGQLQKFRTATIQTGTVAGSLYSTWIAEEVIL